MFSRSEVYSKLIDNLRQAQECACNMAHLHNLEENRRDTELAKGWLAVAEGLRTTQIIVTKMAQGRLVQ